MINFDSKLVKDFFEKGKSDDCPIIDMHAHMFNLAGAHMIESTGEGVIKHMDRSGVKLTLFASHAALFGSHHLFYKDLEVAKRHPEHYRLYYPVTSPTCDAKIDLGAMDKNPEYVGMKFLCDYYNTALSEEKHQPYYEYANSKKMPVLCHTWGNSPYDGIDEARKVLERNPGLIMLAGHSFFGKWDDAIALAKEHKNLNLELTAVLTQCGIVDKFVEAGLSKQIIFGVDAPWFSYIHGIGSLLYADISDEDVYNILYGNAWNILKNADISLPNWMND